MADYIKGKSIIITGAASGFGMLASQKAAAMGAKVTCADVNVEALEKVVGELTEPGALKPKRCPPMSAMRQQNVCFGQSSNR